MNTLFSLVVYYFDILSHGQTRQLFKFVTRKRWRPFEIRMSQATFVSRKANDKHKQNKKHSAFSLFRMALDGKIQYAEHMLSHKTIKRRKKTCWWRGG